MSVPTHWLRRPEYTGPNRCWPCTVLNLALVAVAAALIWRLAPVVAVGVTGLGVSLVVLRGYVVPGTPRFAPRLVAALPFAVSHVEDPTGTLRAAGDADDSEGEVVLDALVGAGVITDDSGELYLDEEFRATWTDRMATLRNADESVFLDRVVAACPAGVEGYLRDDRVVLAGERDVRLRRSVAIAETAAIETLREWGVPDPVRARAAPPLRTFLRTCPACGGHVRETTRQRCCGGPGSLYGNPDRSLLACEDCEAVIVEL